MKKYFCSLLVLMVPLLFTAKANAALAEGVVAPDFTIQAAQGGEVVPYTLYDALKQGPVVIFFYPKAFTSGCTVQAHSFAQAKDRFVALGASILGLYCEMVLVSFFF
jgi:peroxiredoxin